MWREAISLVQNDVASVEDVDKAMWAGPGLRWAAMGPHMLFHLGAGPGGLQEFCNRYSDSFHHWWDSLEDVRITEALAQDLSEGIAAESNNLSTRELAEKRDQLVLSFLQGRRRLESESNS